MASRARRRSARRRVAREDTSKTVSHGAKKRSVADSSSAVRCARAREDERQLRRLSDWPAVVRVQP